MNIIDVIILAVIAISILNGLHRGFISGVLSVAALIGSAALAFMVSGDLAAWLQGNKTLVDTLTYYMDASSRISDLNLSLLPVSQVTEGALAQILQDANLPAAFESAFLTGIGSASGTQTIAQLLSQTIVNVSISILSYLICFLIAYVVLSFVINLIIYVFELPVLRHLDSLIGGVFGLLRGVMLVFIFFMIVPIVLSVVPIDMLTDLINQSRLAPLFDSQLIFSILRNAA